MSTQAAFKSEEFQTGSAIFSLLTGFVVVGVVAPWVNDETEIVTGAELVLVSLLRLLSLGRTREFFWGLLVTGLMLPILAALTASMFYDQVASDALLETAGVALVPGALVVFLGARGVRRPPQPTPPKPSWMNKVDLGLKLGLGIIVFTLMAGIWSELAIIGVIAGALVLVAATLGLVRWRLNFTVRELGRVLLYLGLSVTAVSAVLMLSQGGRVSGEEATFAIVPAAFLVLIGAAMSVAGRLRT